MERLHVGEWEIFPDLNRIRRGEEERHLEPRAMDLLVYLAAHPGEVVGKERIIETVWSEAFVTDGALTYALTQLRHLLDDDARRPRFIETIPRRGYRLIAPVRREPANGENLPTPTELPHEDSAGPAPYPGLAAFTERDSAWFFGREGEVHVLWDRIRQRRLTAVIGSSGSGKTSFLRAGLLARRPDGWGAGYATPGSHPALGLARALTADLASDGEALRELLAGVEELGRDGDPARMTRTARHWRQRWDEAILVVDQFEELFTLNPPLSQSRTAALLSGLAGEAGIRVVVSMRDDFLIRCSDFPELSELFEALTPLPVLRREGLRKALVAPAQDRGFRFEDDSLVEEMLDAVAGVRGALPLLAFAVAQLWERRDIGRRMLTRQAYRDIGGVEGALAQHAEATLERIGAKRRPVVRELFRNLVTAQGTRAVIGREELLSAFSQRDETESVLGELVDARLLTTFEVEDHALGAGSHRVEMVHESLLREWPRLVRWQAQDQEGAVLRDQLRQAAHLWAEKGRPEELLWSGTAFREYQLWRERYGGSLTSLEESYCQAMTDLAGRRRRQKRWIVGGLIGVLVLILAIILNLLQQTERALERSVQDERRAQASSLVALGRLELGRYPAAALAYSRRSLEVSDTVEGRLLALEAIWQGGASRFLSVPGVTPMRAAFSPDGTRLALGGFGNAIAVLGDDGRLLHRLEPLPARADPRGVIYRPDGSGLLTFIVRDPVVREFDLEGRLRRQWPIEAEFLRFGRDGNLLALGPSAEDSRLRVVSVLGSGEADVSRVGVWRQAWETGTDHAGLRAPVALGTLGARFLAYGRKRDIFLQGLGAPGGRSVLLGSHGGDVRSLAVSSDGELLISADEGGELRLWSTSLRRHLASIEGPPIHKYGQTTFEATGRQVAWGSGAAQSSCVWEIDGPPAAPFRCYHVNALDPGSPAFDPQGRWLATPGYSHLTLSRIDSPWARILTGHQEGPIIDLAFSPDGRNLASCARDGLRIWSMEPGREGERRIRLDRPYFAYGAAWMPEGDELILAAPVPGIFRVGLDPDRFTLLMPQPSQSMALGRLATDQSGRKVALTTHYAAESRFMRLFQMDMESGEIQSIQLRGDEEQDPWKGGQRAAGYTWDGRIVTAGDGGIRIWDPATGKLEVLAGGPGTFGVMALNQSGTRLVASLGTDYRDLVFISNSRLLVIDLKSGEQREIHSHGDRLTLAIATDPSGEVIATADVAGTVRVGGIDGSEPYLLLGHKGTVRSVAVSPDRRWVASGSGAEIRLWPIPDLSRRPLHRLPYPELLSLLRSATNLEVREDPASATGFRVESGPFEGWRNAPAW